MGFGVLEVGHGLRVLAHSPPQVLLPAGLWGKGERAPQLPPLRGPAAAGQGPSVFCYS